MFVGGATTALLVDPAAASGARQTEDVDFVIDISVAGDYHQFENRMRQLGFQNDKSPEAPICRWKLPYLGTELILDAMPPDEKILGFTNRWYRDTIKTAWILELRPDLKVHMVDPVYFLATKFEAWLGRGQNDIYSHDLEDVFYVLEHRTGIDLQVYNASAEIKQYLAEKCRMLLIHPGLDNNLPGLVNSVPLVRSRIKFIAQLSDK